MRLRLLAIGLSAACATIAGGSFLTARADTLYPTFHVHSQSQTSSWGGTITCHGHVADETGTAQAGFGNRTMKYRANGQGTIQVLGGGWCGETNQSFSFGNFFWASSSSWTSSRSFITVNLCNAGKFAGLAACKVADGR